jgi:hypothetical protein
MSMEQQTIQRMALVAPNSWDEETRTAEIVISSDRDVGDGFQLLHTAEAIRWPARPLPMDYDHKRTSDAIWGAVTDLRLEDAADGSTQLVGRIVVDGPEQAVAIAVPRMRTGSARFSVDARVYTIREGGSNEPLKATDWEPTLVSLVPRGQDTHAVMRGANPEGDPPMSDDLKAGGDPVNTEVQESAAAPAVADVARAAEPAAQAAAAAPVAPAPAAAPAVAEPSAEVARSAAALKLELTVRRAASEAKLDEPTVQRILNDHSTEIEALTAVVREVKQRTEAIAPAHAGHPARIAVTRDAGDDLMRGFQECLEYRCHAIQKPTDNGRRFIGRSILEMGRMWLEANGVNTDGMCKNRLIDRAFHSTSDFPEIFSNVAGKRLLQGYEEEPQTWQPMGVRRDLPDFKNATNLQLQGQVVPELTLEGGEYTAGTMVEAKATWHLQTFTRKLLVSRQALINDDLNALDRAPMLLGRGCRLMESNQAWGLLTAGSNSGANGGGALVGIDGVALFDASHSNTGTGVIGIESINTGKVKMRKQKDIAGNELNLAPAFLMVPTSLETTALQFLFPAGYAPAQLTGNAGPNPFAGGMQLIVENRLETRSSALWYMAASPNRIEMLEYGYLEGEPGPTITTIERRDPDGVELLVREEFGITVSDFRGFYRSTGA